MNGIKRALLAVVFLAAPVHAYQGGQTKAHNHTSTSGDGGQLSNLTVNNTLSVQGPDPFVDVSWYTSTAVSSMTQAAGFQSAVNALPSGGTLIVPPGYWTIGTSITIPSNKFTLQLMAGTTIQYSTTNDGFVFTGASGNHIAHSGMRGPGLIWAGSLSALSAGSPVSFSYDDEFFLSDMQIVGGSTGTVVRQCWGGRIENNVYQHDVISIHITNDTNFIRIQDNEFYDVVVATGGVLFSDGTSLFGSAVGESTNHFDLNYVENIIGYGVNISSNDHDWSVNNNYFNTNTGKYDIKAAGTRPRVIGNTFNSGAVARWVVLASTAQPAIIALNNFSEGGVTTSTGIFIESNSTQVQTFGNDFTGWGGISHIIDNGVTSSHLGALGATKFQSVQDNGLIYLGPVILQWGTATLNGTSAVNFSFPKTFPTACWEIVGSLRNQQESFILTCTTTQGTVTGSAAGTPGLSYIAVGN